MAEPIGDISPHKHISKNHQDAQASQPQQGDYNIAQGEGQSVNMLVINKSDSHAAVIWFC